MTEINQATIARNVRMWRHDKAKRAVRVEVKRKATIGDEPPLNETAIELEVLHREAKAFGTTINLP